MAVYHASKRGVSTYQFIHELDDVARMKGLPLRFAHMIEQPIILYGDNDVATWRPRSHKNDGLSQDLDTGS